MTFLSLDVAHVAPLLTNPNRGIFSIILDGEEEMIHAVNPIDEENYEIVIGGDSIIYPSGTILQLAEESID